MSKGCPKHLMHSPPPRSTPQAAPGGGAVVLGVGLPVSHAALEAPGAAACIHDGFEAKAAAAIGLDAAWTGVSVIG